MNAKRRDLLLSAFSGLAVTIALLMPIALFWFFWCDWVPDATIARLPNATRAEVQEMLGDPASPMEHKEQARCWCFRRPWRAAEFQVYFDSDGRVEKWWYDR